MDNRQFAAKPYVENPRAGRAENLTKAVEGIVAQLVALNVPFVSPRDIAPHVGISAHALRYHCRNCVALRTWRGSYRFRLEDPGHVKVLRTLLRLALWSVKRTPSGFGQKVH